MKLPDFCRCFFLTTLRHCLMKKMGSSTEITFMDFYRVKCMKKCSVPKNSSVDNVRCIFEDNYIFVENFNTSFWSYQPIP